MSFRIERLTPSAQQGWAEFTYPTYARWLGSVPQLLAIACLSDEEPAGLLLGCPVDTTTGRQISLLSVFTQPSFRRRGIARQLMAALHEVATAVQLPLATTWTAKPGIEPFVALLNQCGWASPVLTFLSAKLSIPFSLEHPDTWCRKVPLPPGASVKLWSEVTPAQYARIHESHTAKPWIKENLVPALAEALEPVNPACGVALELDSEIVGWVLPHATSKTSLRYRTGFVRADLQRRALMIRLIRESFERAALEGFTHCTWTTPLEYSEMIAFIRRRAAFAEYLREIRESFWSPVEPTQGVVLVSGQ